ANPAGTRDIKTHGVRDPTRPKYSFHFASVSERDSVYGRIHAYRTPLSSYLLNTPSGPPSLSPIRQSPQPPRKTLFPLQLRGGLATHIKVQGGVRGRQYAINGTPPATPPHVSATALPRLPAVQVLPLADDYAGKGEVPQPKGGKMGKMGTFCIPTRPKRDRPPSPLAKLATLRHLAVTAAVLLGVSLLGGALVTMVLLHFAAGTVSATDIETRDLSALSLSSEDIHATDIDTSGLNADTIEAGCMAAADIIVNTISSETGSVSVGSDLEVPAVFSLTNA
ncbi:hypothetical protein KIPB_014786, partial [Kipferlia bialata]